MCDFRDEILCVVSMSTFTGVFSNQAPKTVLATTTVGIVSGATMSGNMSEGRCSWHPSRRVAHVEGCRFGVGDTIVVKSTTRGSRRQDYSQLYKLCFSSWQRLCRDEKQRVKEVSLR